MMTNLFEGLKEGDLEDLVLPLISIDEYESKLDDDSIVVAFYVSDREPAQDLNRFLQKGASAVLDTDVSPAPNEDGYYMVFVELLRDQKMPSKLISTLESLEGLTGLTSWKAQMYGINGVVNVNDASLVENLRLTSKEDQEDPSEVQEELTEFFKASDLDDMTLSGRTVTLEARGVTVTLTLVDHGTLSDVYENNAAMNRGTRLDEAANANCRRLQRMLGDLWIAEQRGDFLLLSHALREQVALFRL
jgi:hypothetical protein